MSKLATMVGGHGVAVASVAAVAVVAIGVYSSGVFSPEVLPNPVVVDAPKSKPVTAVAVVEAEAPAGAALVISQVTPEEIQTQPESESGIDATAIAPPVFDVVRVESDGTALIAGKGTVGTTIAVLLDGAQIDSTEIDNSGGFVSFLNIAPSDQARVLTLLMSGAGIDAGIASAQTVILAPAPESTPEAAPATPQVEPPVVVAQMEPEAQVAPATASTIQAAIQDITVSEDTAEDAATVAKPAAPPVVIAALEPEQTDAPEPPVVSVAPVVTPDESVSVTPMQEAVKESETAIVVAPETMPEPEPNAASSESVATEPEIAAQEPAPDNIVDEAGEDTGAVAQDSAPVVAAQIPPAAPVILLADDTGVRVLQAPEPIGAAPDVMSTVALDAITYTPTGVVQIAGRGQGRGFVRVYLDNTPITTSRIAVDGNWRTELPDVDTGIYTLRVDEIDSKGAVVSRIETPFKREEAAHVVAALASSQQPVKAADAVRAPAVDPITSVKVITVQPGSTLWAIARDSYGDGRQYVRVFQANRDRIRNADLIYPGQVFSVPQEDDLQ
ncbi:MAG: LysM peptidoglycan-binding domain-containing protein [Rhodobacterales bacterium]|nr:LysM peptidoglycan-binding domain-containing protein [Rhodobacterales bacterium]